MSSLKVSEYDGILVVDSRLIAEELGIQHKNFLGTLSKYIDEIEGDWGQVAFETETVKNSVGASNAVKYALLTEQQATLLMTYSRNTQQVRKCKRQLVKAFEKAKSASGNEVQLQVGALENKLEMALEAIASLQTQLQNLLSISADYIPPGWSPEIWHSLPPQDKRHFWFLHHRRSFRPSNQGIEPLELPAVTVEQMKQKQHDEFQQVVGEILEEEKKRIEVVKRELLNQFWAEGGES